MILYKTAADLCLDVIAGKWKLLIVQYLEESPKRISEFQSLIPGTSKRVLIRSLRELEEDQIILRVEKKEKPPHIEYQLTDYGRTLKPIIDLLNNWGLTHANKIKTGEDKFIVAEDFDELESKIKKDKRIIEYARKENLNYEEIVSTILKSSIRIQDIETDEDGYINLKTDQNPK